MPGINSLSDRGIKAALKTGQTAEKPKRISDGNGLYLEVRPGGAGWWRLRYHFNDTSG